MLNTNVCTDSQEDVVDVHGRLGRRFHKEKPILLSVTFSLVEFDSTFGCQVSFVARQGNHNIWGGLTLQLFHPDLGPAKSVLIGDVVNNDCSLSPSVISIQDYMTLSTLNLYR